jgi:RNA polymerase sigma-70 factor (ECF subfamily)
MMRVVDAETRFRALFETTYPALHRYAFHRGLSGADADDLVADVLTVAWRRLEDVPRDDPIPWLFAVARNLWRNRLRAGRRDERLLQRLPPAQVQGPPGDPSDGRPGRLRAALAALPEDDQELLRLVAWDGLAPVQIAVVLGCSAGAARVRIHRARTRLAAALVTVDGLRTENGRQSPAARPERPDRPEEHTDATTPHA